MCMIDELNFRGMNATEYCVQRYVENVEPLLPRVARTSGSIIKYLEQNFIYVYSPFKISFGSKTSCSTDKEDAEN